MISTQQEVGHFEFSDLFFCDLRDFLQISFESECVQTQSHTILFLYIDLINHIIF